MVKLRVVQWATGMVGTRALRQILDRPDLDLVGVKVHDPAKIGRDAGDLCDRPATGVHAVGDVDAVLALRPDCVVHTPFVADPDVTYAELATILEAGINVVTTAASAAMHPATMDPRYRTQIEQACAAGGSTLRASGLSPGFANELVPILMSGVCGHIRSVRVGEYANLSHYESKATSELLGWGKDPGYELPQRFRDRLDSAFVAPVRIMATCLGVEVDEVAITAEHAIASRDFDIATGSVGEGTIAGWRFIYDGRVGGESVASIDTSWRLHDEWGTGPGWPTGEAWDVWIDAEPELRLHWEVGPEHHDGSLSSHRMQSSAAHLANSVPAVVAAPPGIMTLADLGLARGAWVGNRT